MKFSTLPIELIEMLNRSKGRSAKADKLKKVSVEKSSKKVVMATRSS